MEEQVTNLWEMECGGYLTYKNNINTEWKENYNDFLFRILAEKQIKDEQNIYNFEVLKFLDLH